MTLENNRLWTGESAYCNCGHRIEDHHTKTLLTFEKVFYCGFTKDKNSCPCREFKSYKEGQDS